MSRLILVPQYPTKLRYQEWWFSMFPTHFANHFDEVIILGKQVSFLPRDKEYLFAPIHEAIKYETQQIQEYNDLFLNHGDVLLLNDLSFPGLFANALFHKRPDKSFAICHATSKNKYDYFAHDRLSKYPIEKASARLFDSVFVATDYHKIKLGWPNIRVTGLPVPPFIGRNQNKKYEIVSVSRRGVQKINGRVERVVEKVFKTGIVRWNSQSWEDYYNFLGQSKVLLITSKEETFGYQIIDAIKNGCIPVAPNRFSYPELLPKDYLYNNEEELIEILNKARNNQLSVPELISNSWYEVVAKIMKK